MQRGADTIIEESADAGRDTRAESVQDGLCSPARNRRQVLTMVVSRQATTPNPIPAQRITKEKQLGLVRS
jgi:hypothetical protein